MSCCAALDALDGDRGCFATADADGGDPTLGVLGLERIEEGDDNACARCADRMAERTGASTNVDLIALEAQIADRGHRNHGERLVDLKEVDIIETPSSGFEELPDRKHGRRREPAWLAGEACLADDART